MTSFHVKFKRFAVILGQFPLSSPVTYFESVYLPSCGNSSWDNGKPPLIHTFTVARISI